MPKNKSLTKHNSKPKKNIEELAFIPTFLSIFCSFYFFFFCTTFIPCLVDGICAQLSSCLHTNTAHTTKQIHLNGWYGYHTHVHIISFSQIQNVQSVRKTISV